MLLTAIAVPFLFLASEHSAEQELDRVEAEPLGRVTLRPTAGLIVFEVRMAGSEPVLFLLDSGASGDVIDTALADKLDLDRGAESERGGAVEGSRVSISWAKNVPFEIGGVGGASYVAKRAAVASVAPLARAFIGVEVGGILGHGFFERFAVEVDYVDGEMTLHDPVKYEPKEGATVVPLVFDKNVAGLPFADVVIDNGRDDPMTVRMLVDSGGALSGTGSLGSKADVDAMVPPELPIYESRSATGLGSSIENVMHAIFSTRFQSLNLSGHEIKAPLIGWTDKSVSFGVLGAQLLSRFDVVFDYRNARLLVTPNERFADPVLYDASGLVIIADAEDIDVRKILYVAPGSPGEKAGLQGGDEIVEFNGRAAKETDLLSMRDLLLKPGEYRLRIERGEEIHSCVLKAEKLL